ncbi:MAG: adenylate kinase [Mariprofundaceae bacterium]|nr:adenylate kinase [Mariprofundaceae bacterium]
MNVLLFGPPGAGKGTQGARLAEQTGIAPIAMGDMLRQAVGDKTQLGLEAKAYMDAGKLVPDAVVIGMIEQTITGKDAPEGFLLDGFPRNVVQAQALDAMLGKNGLQLDRVVFLDASENLLLERLSGRMICKACGFGFHRHYSPPREEGRCDRCGGDLYQRDDDREAVINQRLQVYQEQTAPLLDYYSHQAAFRRVDADGGVQEVYERLVVAMQNTD